MDEELSKTRQKISQLGKKCEILETRIMNTGNMVKASYYERFIVCGKPNCKCHNEVRSMVRFHGSLRGKGRELYLLQSPPRMSRK